jgi:hypothetical protein
MTPVVKTNGHGNGNGAQGISSLPAKKRPLPPTPATADGRVIFQTVEGMTVAGTPVQFNRHNVVWELYNPSLAPRLS